MDDLWSLASRRPATAWAGHPLVLKERTGSTNDDALAAARAGAPHGYAVVADAQDLGRGRRGRAWHSPAGTNVYLSLLARIALPVADAAVITLAAGLATLDAIAPWCGALAPTLKWPNDARIAGRKVAGVLVEAAVRGDALAFAVVGVGINVRGDALPAELADRATTLRLAHGAPPPRDEVVRALLAALEDRLDALRRDGVAGTVAAAAARCDTLGARVRVDAVEGVATALGPDGALRVRTDDGAEVAVRAGEVTLLDA